MSRGAAGRWIRVESWIRDDRSESHASIKPAAAAPTPDRRQPRHIRQHIV
jgi:hypothetical protein